MGLVTLTFDLLTLKLETGMRVASKVGDLHSKFGHAIGLWVLELFAMYATDRQTDRRTGGKKQR